MTLTADRNKAGRGFAAGTLVHAANGLVSIENIQVGDLVLSQAENTGELTTTSVVNTVAYEDKEVILVSYVVGDEMTPRYLVVTGDHPFWVQGKGWLRADLMTGGKFLPLRDGGEAYVYLARVVFCTDKSGFGWTCNQGFESGTEIDFRGEPFEILSESSCNGSDSGDLGVVTRTVYHLEVESCHGFYVGDVAVRVQGERPPRGAGST